MFPLVSGHNFFDAGVDFAELYGVPVQVDSWSLDFTKKLEEEGLGVCDQDLEVLTNTFLRDTVRGHRDLFFLLWPERIVLMVKVYRVAQTRFYRAANHQASARDNTAVVATSLLL